MSEGISSTSESAALRFTPAPLGPRIAAGALDLCVLSVLVVGLTELSAHLGGLMLPVWSALLAIVAYTALPLWIFGATPAMWLFGIEMVGRDGRSPDPIEVIFREMVGRGMAPAAYLIGVLVGIIGAISGKFELGSLVGLGWVCMLCSVLVGVAFAGHVLVLVSEDRRSLADLIGGTVVVPRTLSAVQQDADAEEKQYLDAQRKRVRRNFVVGEVVLLTAAVALPMVLGGRSPWTSRQDYTEHLKLVADEDRLKADPTNQELAYSVAERYELAGDADRAKSVRDRYRQAVGNENQKREVFLKKALAEHPEDEATADSLTELYEDEDRLDDAKQVQSALAKAVNTPEARAEFGGWLYEHKMSAEAVAELTGALAAGADDADAQPMLGFALLDLGRKAEARRAFRAAVQAGADFDDVNDALANLDDELGPDPADAPKPAADGKGHAAPGSKGKKAER